MLSMWEVLKASKGLPVSDFYAAMWGRKMAVKYTVTELEGTLPLNFSSAGKPLMDYRIYGAEGGVGSQTTRGYALTMSLKQGMSVDRWLLVYIGNNPLGKDEYISFSEQKIYRRTGNLVNPNETYVGEWVAQDGTLTPASGDSTGYSVFEVTPGTTYTVKVFSPQSGDRSFAFVWYDSSGNFVDRNWHTGVTGSFSAIAPSNASIGRFQLAGRIDYVMTVNSFLNRKIVVVESDTAPAEYIPYLTPQDPPVPLLEIPTLKGSMTLDCEDSPKPEKMYIKYLEVKND